MSDPSQLLLAAVEWSEWLQQFRTWAGLLWIGLGMLTLALIVLMLTRWGQVRPLSKCIGLSVFAHILFMVYACTTDLFLEDGPPIQEDLIELKLIAQGDESEQVRIPEEPQPQDPWDQFAEQLVTPDVTSPSRLDQPPLDEPQRRVDSAPPSLIEPPTPAAGVDSGVPQLDEPPLVAPQAPRAESQLAATEIEAPAGPPQSPTPQPEDPVALPGGMELARREPLAPPTSTPERNSQPDSLPADVLEFQGNLQTLANVPLAPSPEEAIASAEDRLSETIRPDAQAGSRANPSDASPRAPGALVSVSSSLPDKGRRQAMLQQLIARPAPRRLGDGAQLPDLYRLRLQNDRLKLAQQFGGNAKTEAAVTAALRWLALNQSTDGRWDADALEGGRETRVDGQDRRRAGARADTGISGLALLAFLAAGQTHLEGEYRENVQHGLEYLLRSQAASGSLAGDSQLFAMMYCHGMASLALSEAYAMTGDQRLKPFVERAARYTIESQHPTSGGWRYQPRDQGDMSQFGWQVMALKSAELAGVVIPASTRQGMRRFMGSVASGPHGGLASYRPGERATSAMTAEALACRCFLQLPRHAELEEEATGLVMQSPPAGPKPNLYYWYYATVAMFQIQNEQWPQWNAALQQELLPRQHTEGTLAGSWDPDTVWGRYGGRAYSTALAALSLEVYYRYLPIYARSDLP